MVQVNRLRLPNVAFVVLYAYTEPDGAEMGWEREGLLGLIFLFVMLLYTYIGIIIRRHIADIYWCGSRGRVTQEPYEARRRRGGEQSRRKSEGKMKNFNVKALH